jgi:Uma2 family endonuclease
MNELFSPAQQHPTTQAAEGLPRRRWTVAEIERLTAAGYFHEDDRFELLGGEIVAMSRKGADTKSSGWNLATDSREWRRKTCSWPPNLSSI